MNNQKELIADLENQYNIIITDFSLIETPSPFISSFDMEYLHNTQNKIVKSRVHVQINETHKQAIERVFAYRNHVQHIDFLNQIKNEKGLEIAQLCLINEILPNINLSQDYITEYSSKSNASICSINYMVKKLTNDLLAWSM